MIGGGDGCTRERREEGAAANKKIACISWGQVPKLYFLPSLRSTEEKESSEKIERQISTRNRRLFQITKLSKKKEEKKRRKTKLPRPCSLSPPADRWPACRLMYDYILSELARLLLIISLRSPILRR